MKIDILSLFPEVIVPYLQSSMLKKAQDLGRVQIVVHNIRDQAQNKHRQVDDIPYGGSVGMVLMMEPLIQTIEKVRTPESHVVLLSPKGQTMTASRIKQLLTFQQIILVAGHYEGFDARIEPYVDSVVSLGDFVLTGGELPALCLVDALVRFIPEVLGNEQSAQQDSFESGLLDWDVYTRPREWRGQEVPEVLLSGHHKNIERWKRESAIIGTLLAKPSLLARYQCDPEDRQSLKEYLHKED